MGRVAGKVALVTGAASGIGEASSILLIAEGAKVILCDIGIQKGEALAAKLGSKHGIRVMRKSGGGSVINISSVANMVLYLASDESKFVNGAEFVIDNAATIIEGKIPD